MLNSAILKLKISTKPGNLITNAWLNADGTYAIIELRSEEEVEKAFALKGVSVMDKVRQALT